MATYIGIDPGASGGIAFVRADGSLIEALKMPETIRDIIDALRPFGGEQATLAALERVWAGPRMGSSASFKFGVGVGTLRTALVAVGIAYEEPTPQRWQQVMGCRAGGKGFGLRDDVKAKNITKARAQALFPDVKITHATADAILIAEFARRLASGMVAASPLTNDVEKPKRKRKLKADSRLEQIVEQTLDGELF